MSCSSVKDMAPQKPVELVLFFTRGVSLRIWDETGILARETALYQRLQQHKIRVRFVTYGNNGETAFASRIPGIQILRNNWNLPPAWYQKKLGLFPPNGNVFKSNQVDGAQVGLAAARRRGARFLARCGYLLSQVQERTHGKDSAEARSARQLEKEVFTAADRVSVTTKAMAESITDDYHITAGKLSIVPNYVEVDRFHSIPREPNERPRIGYVGRLAWEKNLLPLVDAVTGLDAELWLVGEGPLKDELEARAAGNKVEAHFVGRLSNVAVPEFLNSCDLFILPSLYEGHPKALLEAMACGLPVIGTRVPGIRELIADGDTGLLCEPDAGSIRQAVARALGDPALRAQLGQAARQYVEQNFALDRIVDLEMAILNELVS